MNFLQNLIVRFIAAVVVYSIGVSLIELTPIHQGWETITEVVGVFVLGFYWFIVKNLGL